MRLCESAGTGLAPDLGRQEAESAGEGRVGGQAPALKWLTEEGILE